MKKNVFRTGAEVGQKVIEDGVATTGVERQPFWPTPTTTLARVTGRCGGLG
jgi:hypothetical protein